MSLKKRTFLFYISSESVIFRISFKLKFCCLILISSIAVINHYYLLNWLLAFSFLILLGITGFLRFGFGYIKMIFFSLAMVCIIWLLFSKIPGRGIYIQYPWGTFVSENTLIYIFSVASKWFLLCVSGLFFLVISSQEELIETLIFLKSPSDVILVATIGFNTIAFILESLSEIGYALESRNVLKNSLFHSLNRIVYISCAVIMTNIKRISMLRIAYFLDHNDIKKYYER